MEGLTTPVESLTMKNSSNGPSEKPTNWSTGVKRSDTV